MYTNGDDMPHALYCTQELTLNSYSNQATFTLWGAVLTPDMLRKLADELEKAENEIIYAHEQEPKKGKKGKK